MTDTSIWLDRWREGRTGWHQSRVHPWLDQYWPGSGLADSPRILVPLCGKSLDMGWFVAHGWRVLGVELSALAIEQFFAEHHLTPTSRSTPDGIVHAAGNIEIIEGDLFAVRPETLASCQGVYDRAALIALPPAVRTRYAAHVYGHLPAGCRGLMVTLEYPQAEMSGPPFSVPAMEVAALLGAAWQHTEVERRDILDHEPKFQKSGISRLELVGCTLAKH
ncbi:MAG: thiopurine S-methyltransferase [Nevskiaceae bacterium]|nr:MAG: thiopurine S-methyltransferase [Nevskiaceae bacterium]TBR72713.1 MAG: thiopurine S-methyltransferase [Nevskiaceae bacterium]